MRFICFVCDGVVMILLRIRARCCAWKYTQERFQRKKSLSELARRAGVVGQRCQWTRALAIPPGMSTNMFG